MGLGILGLGFEALGLGFKVLGLGFEVCVWGSRFPIGVRALGAGARSDPLNHRTSLPYSSFLVLEPQILVP